MGNMLSANIRIRGIRPLLFHHFGPHALPLEKKERTGVAGNDPDEWKMTYLVTENGQLYIDPNYIFSCIRDGSKFTKRGIYKKVKATLQVKSDTVLLNRFLPENIGDLVNQHDQPVYLDIRGVVNKSTGGRNIRYRVALSPGWEATFEIIWDKTIISRGEMHSIIIDAGRFCGVADGRAIGFGRFVVESIDINEMDDEKVNATA